MSVRQGKNYNYDIVAKALIYHDLKLGAPRNSWGFNGEKKQRL